MDSRLRTNLFLFVALAAAGLLIAFGPEPENEVPAGVPLFESGEAISRITVHENDRVHLALEQSGESWRLAAPVELPADAFHVDALLSDLATPASRRYGRKEIDPAALGLAEPEWRITVDDRTFLLGGYAALGNQRYLQAGDDVYLVDARLALQVMRDPFDYASRRLLPEGAKVNAVRLPSGQTITRGGNGWTVVPDNAALAADALQETISAWQDARALRVVAADSTPRDGEVRVTFTNGETLHFGVEVREDKLLLSRADPAVTYVLPVSDAARLLQLAPADDMPVTE